MQNITLANYNKTYTLVEKEIRSCGLVLIISFNESWSSYVMHEILNTLIAEMDTEERMKKIFCLEEKHDITPEWARFITDGTQVDAQDIVLAGYLRDTETIKRAIELARVSRVIALINAENSQMGIQRLEDFGFVLDTYKDVLKVTISLEGVTE